MEDLKTKRDREEKYRDKIERDYLQREYHRASSARQELKEGLCSCVRCIDIHEDQAPGS